MQAYAWYWVCVSWVNGDGDARPRNVEEIGEKEMGRTPAGACAVQGVSRGTLGYDRDWLDSPWNDSVLKAVYLTSVIPGPVYLTRGKNTYPWPRLTTDNVQQNTVVRRDREG